MSRMSDLAASVDEAQAIVPAEPPPQAIQLGTLQADTSRSLVAQATDTAKALRDVVTQTKGVMKISGREYVRVEGWTTLAAMMGVLPREIDTFEHSERPGCYVSTVGLYRMNDGQELTRASAECGGKDEAMWHKRPPYARRSMAQTRATGKACRLAFSWIMQLAGYQPTPAEEMDGVKDEVRREKHVEPNRVGRSKSNWKKRPPTPAEVGQDDPYDWDEPDVIEGETADDPAAFCHFGKNKGVRWDSMSERQIEWYYNNFETSDRRNDQDDAAMAYIEKMRGM